MNRGVNLFFPLAIVAGDLVMTGVSVLVAYYLRFKTAVLPQAQEFHQLSDYTGVAVLYIILFPLLLAAQGGYRIRRSPSGLDELSRIFTVVSIGTVVTMAVVSFVSPDFNSSRAMLSMSWVLAIMLIWIIRMVQYRVRSWLHRRGVAPERVLIVGTGEMARAIQQRIVRAPKLG